MALLTKVVIYGGAGEESGVRVIWDDATNVDAAGEPISKYYAGDSRYLLVIVPAGYRLITKNPVRVTSGTITDTGDTTPIKVDRILFTEVDKLMNLSELPDGEVAPVWYGRSAVLTIDGQRAKVNVAPAIADLTYRYQARQYRLTCPSVITIGPNENDDWPIGVVVHVEKVAL